MRLFICIFILLYSLSPAFTQSGIGIGTDIPDTNAILDIQSNSKGIFIPRLSTTERNTNLGSLDVTHVGLLIFNTSDYEFNYWNGNIWIQFPIATADDFDWSRDAVNGYIFPSNPNDNVGIGTTSPLYPLMISSTDIGNSALIAANFTGVLGSGANALSTSVTGTTSQKVNGVNQLISVEGSGSRTGVYNSIEGGSSGQINGFESIFTNTGSGTKVGLKTDFDFGSGGTQYGIQTSFLLSGSGSLYGMENNFFSTSDVNHYGISNNMVSNGLGRQYGLVNAISGSGGGLQTGVYNPISNSGIAETRGVLNIMGGNGSGPRYGVKTEIKDAGVDSHYGLYNDIVSTGIGDKYGVLSDISNNGSGNIYGIRNNISNTGSGIHYGSYIEITGTGLGDKYGEKIWIDDNAGGTQYGLHSEVLKSGSFAGFFKGDLYIGTSNSDGYIMPTNDGNKGDVIETDGLGQSKWASRVKKVIFKEIQTNPSTPTINAGGWATRPLNTTEGVATFATLSSNQVQLDSGTYHLKITAPIFSSNADLHETVVYDVSNGSILLEGIAKQTFGGANGEIYTFVDGIVSIPSTTLVEIQSYSTSASSLGFTNTLNSNHVFTIFEVEKLD